MKIANKIVDYIENIKYESLDEEIITITKKSILDILGVSIAGSVEDSANILIRQLQTWGGEAQCSVLAHGKKLSAPWAAMINGAMSRALDFDDVVDKFGIHPSVAVFPALLSIAELKKTVSGKDFITAMAIGHDLCIRMARARQKTLLETGRYDLSKVIAATAAAGKLYGLNRTELLNAMGIAYTSTLGEAQCMVDGAMTVHYQQGLVAFNAVMAVLLAKQGLTGAHNIFCGRYGYYNAFEPNSSIDTILDNLGLEFTQALLSYKPYPTCRPNISAICLVIKMKRDYEIAYQNVEEIIVHTNQQIYDLVCAPVMQKRRPLSIVDAHFSLPYNVAVALVKGNVLLDDFSESSIRRSDILELSDKVNPIVDTNCDDSEKYGCLGMMSIELRMKDGQRLTGSITYPKGHPSNTMTFDNIADKFRHCVAYSRNQYLIDNSQKIIEAINDLEKETDIRKLLSYIAEV